MKKIFLGMSVWAIVVGVLKVTSVADFSANQQFFASILFSFIFFTLEIKKKKVKSVVDCDADPFIPISFTIKEHEKIGKIEIKPKSIFLYMSDKQRIGGINGFGLKEEVSDFLIMNANVLDYLLTHQELIPEKCFGKCTVFWGTIYCDQKKEALFVRCLVWENFQWCWRFKKLNGEFNFEYFSAILN